MSFFKDKSGYVCLYNEGVEIYDKFDKIFLSFIKNYEVENFRVPALISKEILEKCNYFNSFPHNLTSVACCSDESKIELNKGENFSNCVEISDEYYLLPSACMHIYPMIKEKGDFSNKVITTSAKVFRNENVGYNDLRRLWDFSVREFVFVGDKEFVLNSLSKLKELALKFAKDLFNSVELVSATDNFYPTKANKLMQMIQKKNSLKCELIYDKENNPLALCSFNYHGTHFSKSFGFDDGEKIVTGCVGFGMERWLDVYFKNPECQKKL